VTQVLQDVSGNFGRCFSRGLKSRSRLPNYRCFPARAGGKHWDGAEGYFTFFFFPFSFSCSSQFYAERHPQKYGSRCCPQPRWKSWLLAQVTLHRGTCGFETNPFFCSDFPAWIKKNHQVFPRKAPRGGSSLLAVRTRAFRRDFVNSDVFIFPPAERKGMRADLGSAEEGGISPGGGQRMCPWGARQWLLF